MFTFAAICFALVNLLCVALTLLTLPGMWLMLLAAVILDFVIFPEIDVFSWQTLAVAGGITLAAEAVEMLASALGVKAVGASRRAAIGSVIGALLGAVFGTVLLPIPVVGTVVGGAIGAGAGAMGMELTLRRTESATGSVLPADWRQAARAGGGAAAGRFVAIIVKLLLAAALAVLLSVAAFV